MSFLPCGAELAGVRVVGLGRRRVEDDRDVVEAGHRDEAVDAVGGDRHTEPCRARQAVGGRVDADHRGHLETSSERRMTLIIRSVPMLPEPIKISFVSSAAPPPIVNLLWLHREGRADAHAGDPFGYRVVAGPDQRQADRCLPDQPGADLVATAAGHLLQAVVPERR